MTTPRFKVGDRVKLRSTRCDMRAGTLGTVQRVYRTHDGYTIQFDGRPTPQFVRERYLERVAVVPSA